MKYFLTLAIALSSVLSSAQNSDKYSTTTSLHVNTGMGKIMNDTGIAIQGSFEYSPFKHFSFEANIQQISTYDGDSGFSENIELAENMNNQYSEQFDMSQKSFTSLGINAIYNPINSSKHKLGIGIGVSYNFKSEISAKRTQFSQNDYESVVIISEKNNGFAPNFIFSYDYIFSNNFMLGLRTYLVSFDDVEESYMLSIGYQI